MTVNVKYHIIIKHTPVIVTGLLTPDVQLSMYYADGNTVNLYKKIADTEHFVMKHD